MRCIVFEMSFFKKAHIFARTLTLLSPRNLFALLHKLLAIKSKLRIPTWYWARGSQAIKALGMAIGLCVTDL